jgi:Uma2 family endonuclease
MTVINTPRRMTTAELLALPDDGVERWLINGELREGGMTRRRYRHSRVTSRLSRLLLNWLDTQPMPRGDVVDGEAGFRLRREPVETTVGIDVAYIDADLAESNADDETGVLDGVPVLAVEVLSPTDEHEDVVEKIETYLACGVKLVWIVDPDLQTVTVYRPDRMPELFNASQSLDAQPHLPGFRATVSSFFAR